MNRKMTIAWHEERLRKRRLSLANERNRVNAMLEAVLRSEEEADSLAARIACAKAKGLTGFDPDRFGISRKAGGGKP